MEYKEVAGSESWGRTIEMGMGIKILVGGIEITEEITKICRHARYDLEEAIKNELWRTDPEIIARKIQDRKDLIACFPQDMMIYVEDIPNEYWNAAHGTPWLMVTTPKGRIKIGWRKRVIVVDWEQSVISANTESLFPDEDVTKSGKMIHAWGYGKATEYLKKILESV